jgi:spermidine synthase
MMGPAIFLLSFAVLFLEMVQCRVFSYSISPVLVYGVITVALLGFGTGGVAVALLHQAGTERTKRVPYTCGIAFAWSVLVANFAFSKFSHMISEAGQLLALLRAIPLLLVLALPYAFAGAFIAAVFAARPDAAGRRYFFNLIGSAVGCFALFVLLKPVGAERCMGLIAIAGAVSALLVDISSCSKRQRAVAISSIAVLSALLPVYGRLFQFRPDPFDIGLFDKAAYGANDSIGRSAGRRIGIKYSTWDPIGRVSVYEFPGLYVSVPDPVHFYYVAIDSGNGSLAIDFGADSRGGLDFFEGTVYGTAYFQGDNPSVLIVGLGAGPDVAAAVHAGARSVTAVEINRSIIEMERKISDEFPEEPYERRNVLVVNGDARSFVRRTKDRFDVIQMNVTDTMNASVSGSLVFSESYLYTLEGFCDFLERLTPNGVFSVVRFPFAAIRTVTTATEAMRKLGIDRPASHMAIVRHGFWIDVLMKMQPYNERDIDLLRTKISAMSERCRGIKVPIFDPIGLQLSSPPELIYWPGCEKDNEFRRYLDEEAVGRGQEYLDRTYKVNLEPTHDDKPFFFFFFGLRDLLFGADKEAKDRYDAYPTMRGARSFLLVCVGSVFWAVILIVLPVILPQNRVQRRPNMGGTVLYFLSLGLGYMAVEIGLIQKTSIFLGHPTYSISFTLGALLIGSGVGALLFTHMTMPSIRRILASSAFVALCVALCSQFLGPALLHFISLPLGARGALVILGTALLGVVMGVPFPSGLRLFCGQRRSIVAWAIGANGFASVIGAAAAIPIAIWGGFRAVLLTGSIAYLCAFATAMLLSRRRPSMSSATDQVPPETHGC